MASLTEGAGVYSIDAEESLGLAMSDAGGQKVFLSAEWKHLILVNYAVDAELLAEHLPPGCEPDCLDGKSFVSLVAFDFLNTKVKGVKWPGFVNFPEINLRAYVRCGDRRGVVFVRELVPSRIVAAVARWLYNEPYARAKMRSEVLRDESSIHVEHNFTVAGKDHRIVVIADREPKPCSINDTAHFFKEHEHGFGQSRSGQRVHYRVAHPIWKIFDVSSHQIAVDFGSIYGRKWSLLSTQEPVSVLLAEGSSIQVYPATKSNHLTEIIPGV